MSTGEERITLRPLPDPRVRAPRRVISLRASNKPGVLARVALVLARRGLNIDALVLGEEQDPEVSHMTLTASGDESSLRLLTGQLNKLVDVLHAEDRTGKDALQTRSALTASGHTSTY